MKEKPPRPVLRVTSQQEFDQLTAMYVGAAKQQKVARILGNLVLLFGIFFGLVYPLYVIYTLREGLNPDYTVTFIGAYIKWKWPFLVMIFAGAAAVLVGKGREPTWCFLGPFVLLFTEVQVPTLELDTNEERPSILSALYGTKKNSK